MPQEEERSNGQVGFLPGEYHAVGVANAPDDYSEVRKRKVRMGMRLARTEELEMPSSTARQLDVAGRPIDNSHHAGTHLGTCTAGWYDDKDRSYHVKFRLFDNEDGRAAAQNLKLGILNDISLTSLEEYAPPTDYVLPDDPVQRKIHAKRCLEHPARAIVWAVGLCYKGARPGTGVRKENTRDMKLKAIEAAWGIENTVIPDVCDASLYGLCSCHRIDIQMASEKSDTPMENKNVAPVPAQPSQQQAAQPMAVDSNVPGSSSAGPVPTANAPSTAVDVEAAIARSNLTAAEKTVLMESVRRGKPMQIDSMHALQHSNVPRDVKNQLLEKMNPTPQPPTPVQPAAAAESSTAMEDDDPNDQRSLIDKTLDRVVNAVSKKDTQSAADLQQTLIPLRDILAEQGIRKLKDIVPESAMTEKLVPLKEKPINVAMLGELLKANPAGFAKGMKVVYEDAVAARAAPQKATVAASSNAGNSESEFTLQFPDKDTLSFAHRYLSALGARPSRRAAQQTTMASSQSSSSASASLATFASSHSGQQQQQSNQNLLMTNGNAATPQLGSAPIPSTVEAKQRMASSILDPGDISDVLNKHTTKQLTFAALAYNKRMSELQTKLKDTPIKHVNPFNGQVTYANSVLSQMCFGPQLHTTKEDMLPIFAEMQLVAARANASQSQNYNSLTIGKKDGESIRIY